MSLILMLHENYLKMNANERPYKVVEFALMLIVSDALHISPSEPQNSTIKHTVSADVLL